MLRVLDVLIRSALDGLEQAVGQSEEDVIVRTNDAAVRCHTVEVFGGTSSGDIVLRLFVSTLNFGLQNIRAADSTEKPHASRVTLRHPHPLHEPAGLTPS